MTDITEFQNPSGIKWNGDVGVVQYGPGDAGMLVMFYNRAVHNGVKSVEAGRPIFEDQVFVKIHPPGERLNIVDRPATDEDRRRFPGQWHLFQQNKQQIPEGSPVELLYPEHPAIPGMLRAYGVHTIEALADLSSNAIDNLGMGAQSYVNAARRYLEAASKGAGASKLRKDLEDAESKVRVLTGQVEQLKGIVAQLQQNAAGAPNLAQVQQLLASVMMQPAQMPGIDAQSAMIAANHPTKAIADARAAKPKRSRPSIRRG